MRAKPAYRTARIGLRASPSLKKMIERAATSDQRTVTNFVEKVLTDHCRQLGYLPDPTDEAAASTRECKTPP